MLCGPIILFLKKDRLRLSYLLLFCAGITLLILTFSRSAWIGFAIASGLVALKYRDFERTRIRIVLLAWAASLALSLFSVHQLIFTRLGGDNLPTETFSSQARLWLAGHAMQLIRQHPLLGIGAGYFILMLSLVAPPGYIIEPVHNIPLLIQSELGVAGSLILAGLGFTFIRASWSIRQPATLLLAAGIMGIGINGLFDHSTWTLAPARLFLGLALGLWAGQRRQYAW
jgi:O-antigen ligase